MTKSKAPAFSAFFCLYTNPPHKSFNQARALGSGLCPTTARSLTLPINWDRIGVANKGTEEVGIILFHLQEVRKVH